MMYVGLFFVIVATISQAYGQQRCGDIDILFAIDTSENARTGSSYNSDPYFYIKDGLRGFIYNQRVQIASSGAVRIGAVAYSSGAEMMSALQPANVALQNLNNFFSDLNNFRRIEGGSFTFRGLDFINDNNNNGQQLFGRTNVPKHLIIISSQGSGKSQHQESTRQAINLLKQRGWTSRVIAVKAQNPMNYFDLDIANNDVRVQPLGGGYSNLQVELNRQLTTLCSPVVPVTPPTTPFRPNPVTVRTTPYTGICANCEGADGRDRDPTYCDRYFDCRTGKTPTPRKCPAGTFFDDWRGCNHIDLVSCKHAPCSSALEGRQYPSGVCCNKYFLCTGGKLKTQMCQTNEIFDENTSRCVVSNDPVKACKANDRYYCDINRNGPTSTKTCPDYFKPDPTGNPCVFFLAKAKMTVPMGTYWNANACSLAALPGNIRSRLCTDFASDRTGTFGPTVARGLADQCTAVFRTQFDRSLTSVINDRIGKSIDVYSIQQGARVENRALVFSQTWNRALINEAPFLYWYRFISKEFQQNTAFRLRFQLAADATIGADYGILSNSYCIYCPESIAITARRTQGNNIEVTATFVPEEGAAAIVARQSISVFNTEIVEAIIIYGVTDVRGQLSTINPSDPEGRPRTIVSIPPTPKTEGVLMMSNKCGLQLGRSEANHFVGTIYEFALYESCKDINQILRK